MTVKQGDLVTVAGETAEVECWWGQGKHKVYRLSDGRTVFDLEDKLDSGEAKLEKQQKKTPSLPKQTWPMTNVEESPADNGEDHLD